VSFLRIEDTMPEGPKFDGISSAAGWLHVCAMAYASKALTDGFVPAGRIYKLTNDAPKVIDQAVCWLVSLRPGQENPLWHEVEGGWLIHDFTDPEYGNVTKAGAERFKQSKAEAGRAGGKASVAARRSRYGTAQPASVLEASPEAPASKHLEAGASKHGKQTRSSVPYRSAPGPTEPDGSSVQGIALQRPVSGPANGEGLPAVADPRTALGDRLVAAIGELVAGGVLSPLDQKRVRNWPYAFQHLAGRGEEAFLAPCRRSNADAVQRGTPPKTPRYFEALLIELDAAIVDNQAVPTGRGHHEGMARLGDLLPGVGR
jgi:hypothetical protein